MNKVTLRVEHDDGRDPDEISFETENEYFRLVGEWSTMTYGTIGKPRGEDRS